MKRVNKEHMSAVLQHYMKKRNYAADELDSSKRSTSLPDSVVSMAANNEVSSVGVINCGCVTDGNSFEYERQFDKLVRFVREAPDQHKQMFMQTLFPVFISIYIDMLVAGLKPAANKFHQKNKSIFGNLPIYKSSMESIALVVQKCDRDRMLSMSAQLHSELGETKFSVSFTSEALHYLQNYLCRSENMIILQVINSNLSIEIMSDPLSESTTPSDLRLSPPVNRTAQDEATLNSLKSSIARMRDMTPPIPNVKLYSVSPGHRRVNCGVMTKDKIVLGCGDNSVQIWSKSNNPIQHLSDTESPLGEEDIPALSDVSRLRMAGDTLEDVVESEKLNRPNDDRRCVTMRGHSSDVYGVAPLDCSNYILSCSADRTIRLWDTDSCLNKVIYRGHTQTIWSLAKGNNCSYFASASKDRTAKLWTTERTFPLRCFTGHLLSVDCVQFHPNNGYLATGSQDKTVRLWSTVEGKCVRLMQGHKSNVLCLAFSPNGRMLASAGEDRRIRLWDLGSGDLIKEIRGHADTIHCLEFTPGGSMLCSGGLDNVILCWDTRHSSDSYESPVKPAGLSDALANISTQDSTVISLQSALEGVMSILGIT